MKNENEDTLRQDLRLAQLEIKMLREQLLKSTQDLQQAREEIDQLSGKLRVPLPPQPVAPGTKVIVPLPREAIQKSRTRGTKNGRPCVLYVEDSEPNYRLMENILEDRPETELVWAETGQRALLLAREKRPQLVLLDLDLPDMHGSKVLEGLQNEAQTADTPVIVISADATPSQIERMLAAGARNYLTKPFEIRRFLCMFDEVFAPTPEPATA